MKGKLCTTFENFEATDINDITTSVEGKFGRIVLHTYRDSNGLDRFKITAEPKPSPNEPRHVVKASKECLVICDGLLDFENLVKFFDTLKNDANTE